MPLLRRLPLVLAAFGLAAVLLLVPGRAANADADGILGSASLSIGQASATVGDTSVRVSAVVDPARSTTIWFEYGTTTAFGKRTDDASLTGLFTVRASATLTGLAPATEYYVRLVGADKHGRVEGAPTRFVTAGTPTAPPALPVSPLPSLPLPALPLPDLPLVGDGETPAETPAESPEAAPAAPETPAAPAPAAPETPADDAPAPELESAPAPAQGTAVVAGEVAGQVRVKTPGGDDFSALTELASVPVGSVVDARRGTIALSTETAAGTQTGEFRGAVFQVRQSRDGSGMTELHLKGGAFAACARTAKTVARAAAKRPKPVRSLWGKDKGGRFRTHGRDSVATVRGTEWRVADRCDGTVTTVTEGAVMVRDRHTGKRTLVRAGERHFARHR